MANTEFLAVSWAPNQLIDEDSLDQMSDNITYLKEQAVDGVYQHLGGGTVDTKIKLLCGRQIITPRKGDDATVRVSFAKLFTTNSTPVITTSITSTHQTNIFITIQGIGRAIPNHQGFVAKVNVAADKKKQDKIARKIYINWIAMGY